LTDLHPFYECPQTRQQQTFLRLDLMKRRVCWLANCHFQFRFRSTEQPETSSILQNVFDTSGFSGRFHDSSASDSRKLTPGATQQLFCLLHHITLPTLHLGPWTGTPAATVEWRIKHFALQMCTRGHTQLALANSAQLT
jgi:hypothetical protein